MRRGHPKAVASIQQDSGAVDKLLEGCQLIEIPMRSLEGVRDTAVTTVLNSSCASPMKGTELKNRKFIWETFNFHFKIHSTFMNGVPLVAYELFKMGSILL